MRRPGLAPTAMVVMSLLFALWSWLTFSTGLFASFDATSLAQTVGPMSAWGQILAGIALITTPAVLSLGLAAATFWAGRRRLNHLAWAMGLAIPLVWGGSYLMKLVFHRQRPPTALPLITSEGFSYPSGHMMAITAVAVLAVSAFVHTRQRTSMVILVSVVAAAAWILVGYNRWALRAHWFTDVIGGTLLGAALAALALTVAGVRVEPLPSSPSSALGANEHRRRVALIINPTRIPDPAVFRRQVASACAQRGWAPPVWLETEVDDPGRAAARRAQRRRVDLVIAAGGDGTVRAVCGSMAGTEIPVAILPVGTANLLARNLGIPLDLSDALEVAFDGEPRPIDLVQIRADDHAPQPSVVMAGMGADAALMQSTNEDLKKMVGTAAYVVAVPSGINQKPFAATIAIDDREPEPRIPRLVLVANVGRIPGVDLSPGALPDDGLFDVALASPKHRGGWAAITTSVLARSTDSPSMERTRAKRIVIDTEEPIPYQIDGDAVGTCQRFDAALLPLAIRIIVPSR